MTLWCFRSTNWALLGTTFFLPSARRSAAISFSLSTHRCWWCRQVPARLCTCARPPPTLNSSSFCKLVLQVHRPAADEAWQGGFAFPRSANVIQVQPADPALKDLPPRRSVSTLSAEAAGCNAFHHQHLQTRARVNPTCGCLVNPQQNRRPHPCAYLGPYGTSEIRFGSGAPPGAFVPLHDEIHRTASASAARHPFPFIDEEGPAIHCSQKWAGRRLVHTVQPPPWTGALVVVQLRRRQRQQNNII